MPSSNKTTTLGLNRWLGSDKPVKDDFNEDNRLIDEAMAALTTRVGTLESSGGGGGSSEALDTHIADTAVHCTAEEKALWNAAAAGSSSSGGGVTVGTYTGDGSFMRTITLESTPKAGVLFAVNRGLYEIDWTANSLVCMMGFISAHGASQPITLAGNAMTVYYQSSVPANGVCYRLNEADVTYVYFLWE